MKKIIITILMLCLTISFSMASTDRYSKEYLQNNKHIAAINPLVERIVEKVLKKELKKETGADFNVKFTGYTTSSIKKGIFKYLELSANDLTYENIPVKYVHFKTLTDYNYIDFTKNPVEYKSDITFAYNIELTEDSLNAALKSKRYENTLNKVNKISYPLFSMTGVRTKIADNRLYVIMEYIVPLKNKNKVRTFIPSTDLKIENGRITTKDVRINSRYGNVDLAKVANLINLLNPLEYTLSLVESSYCKINVENVNIIDNIIKVDGKIYIRESAK